MLGRVVSALFASAALCSIGLTSAEADLIDTTGTDSGNVVNFGDPDTASYGQTFSVGSGTFLDSFSLYLRGRWLGDGPLDLRGYVAEWNGSMASSILFESATQTMNAAADLQEFAFSPDLNLISGHTYVAFLSISNLPDQTDSQFGMPYGADSILGQFVFLNHGHNFGDLTTQPWTQNWLGDADVWFKASLLQVEVPEPATIALFGAGLLGLGWIGRRRKV